jgi:hypothetical protein
MMTTELAPSLWDRWCRWDARQSEGGNPGDEVRIALRADGSLMILDEWGWFLIVKTGPGVVGGEEVAELLKLEDSNARREEVYMEPAWLWGYFDMFQELLSPTTNPE